jgi:hypothetical protein
MLSTRAVGTITRVAMSWRPRRSLDGSVRLRSSPDGVGGALRQHSRCVPGPDNERRASGKSLCEADHRASRIIVLFCAGGARKP